ncbi:MAG TPA: class I SAM-dependent methyltransferase, partial [Anaerolineae bacterium]|nr:class I SAM-dependent methyltransferase [Anaerolineae bacterium]
KPKMIFEFGTYKGDTTYHLAKCNPDSQLTTIDFPPSEDGFIHYNQDTDFPVVFKPGERFYNTPEAARITQLQGDTTTFDFSDHYGKYDFIYIDAEHEYKWGMSDSLNAFKMLKKGGTIVWDDYATWPGLKQAVEELAADKPIYHIESTRLAIMQG